MAGIKKLGCLGVLSRKPSKNPQKDESYQEGFRTDPYKIASGAPKTGDPKHSFLAFPESVQKVVGSMSKIGQFFDHLNF